MKFVWAFLIVITCLIPFLIGAGFGMDALLKYCSSDTTCHSYEICKNYKCIDLCAESVCGENEYCDMIDHHAICKCLPGFLMNPITQRCEQRSGFHCNNDKDCGLSSKCINNACIGICHQDLCGPFETCRIVGVTRKPKCFCRPGYKRNPNSNRCLKHCVLDEDCEDEEACSDREWCDTPCTKPNPLHSHCVPRGHKATYECDECYRPANISQYCERDTDDVRCSSKI